MRTYRKKKVANENEKVSTLFEMDSEELKKCVEGHEKNASQIAADLGISRSGMSNWINGKRGIDERDAKLLRLYFYGEIPFDDIRPTQDLSNVLKFSEKEWGVITILATRSGKAASEWIAAQIREHPTFLGHAKPGNIIDPSGSKIKDSANGGATNAAS